MPRINKKDKYALLEDGNIIVMPERIYKGGNYSYVLDCGINTVTGQTFKIATRIIQTANNVPYLRRAAWEMQKE